MYLPFVQHKRTSSEDFLTSHESRTSLASIDRPGGQPISPDELRNPPRATYAHIGHILSNTDSEVPNAYHNHIINSYQLPADFNVEMCVAIDAQILCAFITQNEN